VYDLQLGTNPEYNEVVVTVHRALVDIAPDLVVSHEEPGALLAAHLLGLECLFLTHWFTTWEHPSTHALRYSAELIFLSDKGIFPEPPGRAESIRYCGPVVRPLCVTPSERDALRGRLGMSNEVRLIVVVQGSAAESDAPLAELVLKAFRLVAGRKRLVWFADGDKDSIESRLLASDTIEVRDQDPALERWLLASDATITKGTYNLNLELRALGVPFVVVSSGHNHIDDLYSQRLSRQFLWAGETEPDDLARRLEEEMTRTRPAPDTSLLNSGGAHAAASGIARRLRRPSEIATADQSTT
jgi:predicted glycosyltransferase